MWIITIIVSSLTAAAAEIDDCDAMRVFKEMIAAQEKEREIRVNI